MFVHMSGDGVDSPNIMGAGWTPLGQSKVLIIAELARERTRNRNF